MRQFTRNRLTKIPPNPSPTVTLLDYRFPGTARPRSRDCLRCALSAHEHHRDVVGLPCRTSEAHNGSDERVERPLWLGSFGPRDRVLESLGAKLLRLLAQTFRFH